MSPRRAARVCPVVGCPNLVSGSERYCPEHMSEKNRNYNRNRYASGYTREYGSARWREIARRYLAEHPTCIQCGRRAEVAHHIIEKENGGSDDDTNLRALCKSCHSRLHARARGGVSGEIRHE